MAKRSPDITTLSSATKGLSSKCCPFGTDGSKQQPLTDEFKDWERVFACLHDLRRWSARDRVSATHAEILTRLASDLGPDETMHVEIEIVFRHGAAAENARSSIRRQLAGIGTREVAAARYDGFAYDALLVEISKQRCDQR